MDHSQSETVRQQYEGMMAEVQRIQARRSRSNMNQPGGAPVLSMAGVYDLARLAEIITEAQLLEIEQDARQINVKREGSFALVCDFGGDRSQKVETGLGSEACGWQDHQLLFHIYLPEGLSIQHRLTLGPQGERLQIATTLRSRRSSFPFTVDKVYNRFDPEADGIRCRQTLSRGRVCTTESE